MLDLLTKANRYKYRVTQNRELYLYEYNESTCSFERMMNFDSLSGYKLLLNFIGFKRVSFDDMEDELEIPEKYIMSIVYYIKAKVFLENGDIEKHNYYYGLFNADLRTKRNTVKTVKSEPSEYSLR